jgi:hypothetical protein
MVSVVFVCMSVPAWTGEFLSFYFRGLHGHAVKEAFANFHFPLFQIDKDCYTYPKGLIYSVLYVLYHDNDLFGEDNVVSGRNVHLILEIYMKILILF